MRKLQLRTEVMILCMLLLLSIAVTTVLFPIIFIFTGSIFSLVGFFIKLLFSKRYEEI